MPNFNKNNFFKDCFLVLWVLNMAFMKDFLPKCKVISDWKIILFSQVSGEYSSFLFFFYSYIHWLLIYMLLFVMASKFLKSSLWPLSASLTKVVERKTDHKSFVSATKLHFQSSKKCIWGLLTPELSCYCNRKTVLFLMTIRVATLFNHIITKFQKPRSCRSASPLK